MKTAIKYFLQSLALFTKEPASFVVEGDSLEIKPFNKIVISPSFFKSFNCARCCVCCQKGISPLVYSKSDVDRMLLPNEEASISKLLKGLKEIPIFVNGNKRQLYLYEFEGFRCGFDKLTSGDDIWSCELHMAGLKQLLCFLPWIRITKRESKAVLTKKPFGYTWAFGCRAYWEKEFNEEQFLHHDLEIIRRLIEYSEDLNLKTFWPEVLEYLENWYKLYKEGKVSFPKEDIVIGSNIKNQNVLF
jgi:hypothetical protein